MQALRSPWVAPVLVGLVVLLGGCTPSRSVQCQRLSEIARTVQESAQSAVSGRTAAIARAATGFSVAIDQLNGLGHLDDDLVALRGTLLTVYGSSEEATNQFLQALEDRDRAQATTAVQRLEALAQDEQDALAQLKQRCYPEAEDGSGAGDEFEGEPEDGAAGETGGSPEPTASPSP